MAYNLTYKIHLDVDLSMCLGFIKAESRFSLIHYVLR